jgi:hypothetical protein
MKTMSNNQSEKNKKLTKVVDTVENIKDTWEGLSEEEQEKIKNAGKSLIEAIKNKNKKAIGKALIVLLIAGFGFWSTMNSGAVSEVSSEVDSLKIELKNNIELTDSLNTVSLKKLKLIDQSLEQLDSELKEAKVITNSFYKTKDGISLK